MTEIHDARTALVLGGGGAAGNAWLIGVTAGLLDAGLDVTGADLTVGTSAGSTAAAQLAGTGARELLADILDAVPHPRSAPAAPDRGSASMRPTRTHLETTNEIIASARDVDDMRRRMGAWAIDMAAAFDDSAQARWRATVGDRFPGREWPSGRLLITAVDADTGQPVVFDRDSGVDLVDAVAASTAGGFAYRIGGHRYFDGGYRTNADNADLAAGYGRVLIVSPFGGRTRLPLAWGLDLATQVAELRAAGGTVETIYPDENAVAAFGNNMMDLSVRPAAARAGFEQGRVDAERLKDSWAR